MSAGPSTRHMRERVSTRFSLSFYPPCNTLIASNTRPVAKMYSRQSANVATIVSLHPAAAYADGVVMPGHVEEGIGRSWGELYPQHWNLWEKNVKGWPCVKSPFVPILALVLRLTRILNRVLQKSPKIRSRSDPSKRLEFRRSLSTPPPMLLLLLAYILLHPAPPQPPPLSSLLQIIPLGGGRTLKRSGRPRWSKTEPLRRCMFSRIQSVQCVRRNTQWKI